jgi:hypothetical protein
MLLAVPSFSHNNLKIDLPDGWRDASQYLFAGPVADGINSNIVLTQQRLKDGESAESIWSTQKPQVAKLVQKFKLLVEEKKSFGKLSGISLEFTGMQQGRLVHQLMFVFSPAKGSCWSVTGTSAPSQVEPLRKVFMAAINSLKLS